MINIIRQYRRNKSLLQKIYYLLFTISVYSLNLKNYNIYKHIKVDKNIPLRRQNMF